jgi:uncharacterized repeat protein (TIGR01451 family)
MPRRAPVLLVAFVVASSALAPAPVRAADTGHLQSWVIAAGGGESTGGPFRVVGTIGEPVAAVSSNESYTLESGFWDQRTDDAVLVGSELVATKTASASIVAVGDTLVYTIAVHNNGPAMQADQTGSELVDVVPAELTIESVEASVGIADVAGQVVSWNGALGVGQSLVLTITTTVAGTGLIANQASVAFDRDGDGSAETTLPSDDPTTAATSDATQVRAYDSLFLFASGFENGALPEWNAAAP